MKIRSRRLTIASLLAGLLIGGTATAADQVIMPVEHVSTTFSSISNGLRTRDVLYVEPRPSAPGYQTPAPAIVLLSFLGGDGAQMAAVAEAAELARDRGYFSILPSPSAIGGWQKQSLLGLTGDVALIDAAIDDAIARYPIDPSRIYVAGYSDGGRMTMAYVCARSERVAGAGVVATGLRAPTKRGCTLSSPTPIAFIHGTDDPLIPYNGNLFIDSQREGSAFFANRNGCDLETTREMLPDTVDDDIEVQLDRYGNCDDDAEVRLYTVVGGGHTWPGTFEFSPDLGRTAQDISATRTLVDFIGEYTKP